MADHEKQLEDFGKNDDFWLFGYGSLIWKPPPHYDQRVPGYIEGYVRRFWQASEDHRGTPEAPGRVATLIDKAHWETLTDHHESTERVWGAAYHIPASKVDEVRAYLDIREINGYSIQFTPFHPSSSPTPSAKVTTHISSPPTSPPTAANVIQASTTMTIHAVRKDLSHHLIRFVPSTTTTSTTTTAGATGPASASVPADANTPSAPANPIQCLVYIGLPSNPQFLGPQDPDALARHILQSRGPSGENREYLFLLEEALLGLSEDSGDTHVSDLVRRCREIEARGDGDEAVGDAAAGAGGETLHKVGSTEEQEEVEK